MKLRDIYLVWQSVGLSYLTRKKERWAFRGVSLMTAADLSRGILTDGSGFNNSLIHLFLKKNPS